uniref:Uncharacterized protein n=1 Tax=Eutreptiella gymnastica TaxID=73025 RepID=A0A7S4GHT2_9EUGL|mmetsp:Transcript_87754/g.145899  ORF Transcript_87754/g.145899 Transcript_87754/m.145899 type:complete len:168 (-) Transcript_87754:246-749(-)
MTGRARYCARLGGVYGLGVGVGEGVCLPLWVPPWPRVEEGVSVITCLNAGMPGLPSLTGVGGSAGGFFLSACQCARRNGVNSPHWFTIKLSVDHRPPLLNGLLLLLVGDCRLHYRQPPSLSMPSFTAPPMPMRMLGKQLKRGLLSWSGRDHTLQRENVYPHRCRMAT